MIDTPQDDDGEPDMEPSDVDDEAPETPNVTRPKAPQTTASLELLGAGQPYKPRH